MFGELLERVLSQTPGAVGVTLMGFDGIAIDSRESSDPGEVSLQAAAIELGAIAKQLQGVAESLGAGEIKEVSFQTGPPPSGSPGSTGFPHSAPSICSPS